MALPDRRVYMPSLSSCDALVVEDDDVLAEYVAVALDRHGVDAHCARNGRSGVRALRADPPDLLVSDWRLPHVDGIALLRTARSVVPAPVGAVLMTAYHTPELRRQSVAAGADVFLEKPFRRAALTNAAETALQAARHRMAEP